MSDLELSKEVTRLRHLLLKMAELAEHVEQTGSFQSGLNNSIMRYNTIVQRLEEIGACPKLLFPSLDSEASAGTLGAEATLLAEYLEDMVAEGKKEKRSPDMATLVSLAPFLGREELNNMVRSQFSASRGSHRHGGSHTDTDEGAGTMGARQPGMKEIVALAPHLGSSDLGEILKAYVAREKGFDPACIVQLAPHLSSKDLGEIIRRCMPDWFSAEAADAEAWATDASAEAPEGSATAPAAHQYAPQPHDHVHTHTHAPAAPSAHLAQNEESSAEVQPLGAGIAEAEE